MLLAAVATLAASEPPRQLWSFDAGASIQSSPAVGPDGTIYFGCDSGEVFALAFDGALRWSFKTGGAIAASPAVAQDGTVYVASTDRVIYAFHADGRLKWLQSPGNAMAASPAVRPDGGVVAATVFNTVVAYGASGAKHWEHRAGGNIVSSPAIAADGTIYFGAKDNRLYALSGDGRVKWRYQAQGNFNASPALGADGAIYLGSLDGVFHAVNPDGTKRWEFKSGDAIRSSAAIGADGTIFFGCDDKKLYALTSDGKLKWACETGDQVRSSPAVTGEGTVLVGSYDRKLHAVGADGAKLWEFATGGQVSASPTLRADGGVVFGSWDRRLYALSGEGRLAESPWPKFRGDLRQSGGVPADKGAARLEFTVVTGRDVLAPALLKLAATLTGRDDVASKVEFFEGERKLGEVVSPPYLWNWPDVEAGTYTISARATLLSGLVIVSPQVRVTVHAAAAAAPQPMPKAPGPPDHTPPRVFISAPLTETRFENAELELRGKADDDVRVAAVEWKLNDLPFQKASGTTSWSAGARLKPGENTLVVRAIDTAGNVSAEVTKTLTHVLRLPLDVSVAGEGTIRSDQEERLVEAGRKVALRAVPAPGHVFAGWTGSLTNSAPEISFVMTEGLRLKALFVPNPYAAMAGDFTGLVTERDGDSLRGVGLLEVSINDRGVWDGRLWLGDESHPVNGAFGPAGASLLTIARGGRMPWTLALKVDLGGDPDLITGTLSGGDLKADVIGDRRVYDGRSARAPQAGHYTLVMMSPDAAVGRTLGDGFGALNVDEKGMARLNGMLGDGTPVKFDAALSRHGIWPVFVSLYDGRGSLAGWVRFKHEETGDLFGRLVWRRPMPGGIGVAETTVSVLGARFQPPAKGQPVLARKEGMAALRGGDLPEPLVEWVRLGANQRVAPEKDSPSELALTIATDTGLFSGNFVHPLTGRLVSLQGAVLQPQKVGAGCFIGLTNAGRVSFTFDLAGPTNSPRP